VALATACAGLCGCGSFKSTYWVSGVELPRADAQRAIIEKSLLAELRPPLDAPLKFIVIELPEYSPAWSQVVSSGEVIARFCIEADGSVSEVTVSGAPPPQMAQVTLDAIRRWRFVPPTRKGRPVTVCLPFAFEFQPG
jgi:TonB family protein